MVSRTEADIKAIYDEIDAQTDRGAAIIAAAILDDFLSDLIKKRLVLTPKIEQRIFNFDTGGLASEYTQKIDLAFSIGLFNQKIFEDLRLIGKIRNRFAHKIDPITFSDPEIAAWCQTLHNKGIGKTPRDKYLISFLRISTILLILKNVTDMRIRTLAEQIELREEMERIVDRIILEPDDS
jgi:DNA-binding MltR family transcriptional regulator